jgi:L-lactate dehydrogenase complex protein LldG
MTYDDRRRQFCLGLEAVGGRAVVVRGVEEINRALQRLAAYRSATRVCSFVVGVGPAPVDLDAIADPRALNDVDFCIAPGAYAVAENGAVWVAGETASHHALYFLTQHLALVIPTGKILDNMHQAYQRLTFDRPGFGVFISGPSKTADIEQALVVGAHGPRSLTVFLVEESPSQGAGPARTVRKSSSE